MRQHLSQENDLSKLIIRIWTDVRKHVKQAGPALLAIAIFLGVVSTFALGGDQRQALGTAMLVDAQAEAQAKADSAAKAAAAVQVVDTPAGEVVVPRNYAVGEKLEKMTPLPPQQIDTETLWLARGIYSETKEPQEQELVAWTLRNRVETGYRGNGSYQEAVLDPYQYSAFNPGTRTRKFYTGLTPESDSPGFKNALSIARQVKEAPPTARPFKETTRHFYSEQSMAGGRTPAWARGEEPVTPGRPIELDEKRFRFFADIR